MKRYLPLLIILALFVACGAPEEREALPEEPPPVSESLPETSPVGEVSAPAVVTEGREPGQTYDLPKQLWYKPITEGELPLLVAELPEEDAAFYALEWDRILIRWGRSQAEFNWDWLTPHQILPRLYCLDFDGDWDDELVVICHTGSGTGVAYDEMHVLEKGPDGTLTDYALPWEMFTEELSGTMSAATVNGRTYVILGTQLVDITDILWEEADPEAIEELNAGSIVHFEATPDSPFGHHFRYQGSAWLVGEGYTPTGSYAVDLDASVSYQDGVFSLTDIHLS